MINEGNSAEQEILLKNHDIESIKELPFAGNEFDIVTMLAVFEHLEPGNIQRVFSEVYRVLKKDGLLILTTPAVWSDRLLRVMAILNLVSKEEISEHKSIFPGFFFSVNKPNFGRLSSHSPDKSKQTFLIRVG